MTAKEMAKQIIQNKIEFETGILELHKKDLKNIRNDMKDYESIVKFERLTTEKGIIQNCIMIKEEVIMVLKELLEEID